MIGNGKKGKAHGEIDVVEGERESDEGEMEIMATPAAHSGDRLGGTV